MKNEVSEGGGENILIDKIQPATRRDMMGDWEPGARVLPGERALPYRICITATGGAPFPSWN
jgi:hypothetical protein